MRKVLFTPRDMLSIKIVKPNVEKRSSLWRLKRVLYIDFYFRWLCSIQMVIGGDSPMGNAKKCFDGGGRGAYALHRHDRIIIRKESSVTMVGT